MSKGAEFSDVFYLHPAQRGDWDVLAEYIEGGGKITDAMREFLAGVLRRKIKRAKRRPHKQETVERAENIAYFVAEAKHEGMNATKATAAAAKRFRVTTRTVQRAVAQHHEYR